MYIWFVAPFDPGVDDGAPPVLALFDKFPHPSNE